MRVRLQPLLEPNFHQYWGAPKRETLTIRHSNPNASTICFIPGMSLWLVRLIFLPRFTSGLLGPSKTKIGKNVVCIRVAQRKKSVRKTGFSPSRPYSAWKNQMLASIPRRKPRLPSGLASNPSFIARSVRERTVPAGLRTCIRLIESFSWQRQTCETYIPKACDTHREYNG